MSWVNTGQTVHLLSCRWPFPHIIHPLPTTPPPLYPHHYPPPPSTESAVGQCPPPYQSGDYGSWIAVMNSLTESNCIQYTLKFSIFPELSWVTFHALNGHRTCVCKKWRVNWTSQSEISLCFGRSESAMWFWYVLRGSSLSVHPMYVPVISVNLSVNQTIWQRIEDLLSQ